MTMITPSYLGETIEYSSLHACRSTLEDPTTTVSTYGDSYARGEWDEWASYGAPMFRGQVAANVNAGQVLVGDNTTADVWSMQMGVYSDAGGPLTRQASAFVKVEEGVPRCTALVLHCVMGVGNPTPPGVNPIAEMRYSDDLGRTFSHWLPAPLNPVGAYGAPRAAWTRLGSMRAPGRLVEVRCSDPVNAVFSHLELNPVRPGW